jgi:hypothetical protein
MEMSAAVGREARASSPWRTDGEAAAPMIQAFTEGEETDEERQSPDQPLHRRAPIFRYQYPPDLPAPEQLAIEEARLEANTQLECKSVGSYDEHRAARIEWFWRVVCAAAEAIGRAGASLQWGANERRELLRDFAMKAAQAARVAGPRSRHFEKLCESPEWHALDDRLLLAKGVTHPSTEHPEKLAPSEKSGESAPDQLPTASLAGDGDHPDGNASNDQQMDIMSLKEPCDPLFFGDASV